MPKFFVENENIKENKIYIVVSDGIAFVRL